MLKTTPFRSSRARHWSLGIQLIAIVLLAFGSGGCAFLAGAAAGAGGVLLLDRYHPHCCWYVDPERPEPSARQLAAPSAQPEPSPEVRQKAQGGGLDPTTPSSQSARSPENLAEKSESPR